MSHINTYWEKDLDPPREAFKVSGDVGYTKSTDILLNYVSLNTLELDKCTATFEIDVVGDTGSSAVVIYNNGMRVPFYINNTEYQQLAWNSQSSKTTITIPLNYVTANNIQARYLGNGQCLGSRSKVVSITEPRPPAAESSLAISLSKTSFRKSESVSGTITLTADSHYSNVPIKLWVDDELISTTNTDSNGEVVFTLTTSDLNTGINKIKAEFAGNIYIYGAKKTVEISHGWNIKVLSYDKVWLNYIGAVQIRVTDYFDNPVVNEIFYTDNSDNLAGSLSGRTDNGGYATIENHNSGSTTPRFTTFVINSNYGDMSQSITPRNATLNEFEIITQGIISEGYSLPIKVRASAVDDNNEVVPLQGVKVSCNKCNPSYIYLDSNGESNFEYLGESRGDVLETFTLGSNGGSKSITIEDCVTYWTRLVTETEYHFDESYRVESAKVYRGTGLYRLSGMGDFGQIHFDRWDHWSGEWTFEFQVRSITNPDSMMLCGYYLTNVKQGDRVKLVRDGSTKRVYVNDALKGTYQGSGYTYPLITFNRGSEGRIEIRRLKFKINMDDIYNVGNIGYFTIKNDHLFVEFGDDERYCSYSLENGHLYVETELPSECFNIENGKLYFTTPSD